MATASFYSALLPVGDMLIISIPIYKSFSFKQIDRMRAPSPSPAPPMNLRRGLIPAELHAGALSFDAAVTPAKDDSNSPDNDYADS
jgi:hypothetical protein